MPDAPPSLYDRLGGVYRIAEIVDDFIDRVMDDPALNANPSVDEAHHRVSKAGFKYLVTELVCWAAGGPQKYTGKTMRDSHEHLGITAVEWQVFLQDLRTSFDKFRVPPAEQTALIAIVESTKGDIVAAGPGSTANSVNSMKQLKGVYPISGDDLSALPVKEIGPAVKFYTSVLGFSIVASDEATATVQRDDARLGLTRKPDHQPEEAGSCALAVTDLDAMHRELDGRGLDLGSIKIDEWGGMKYRVFFLREAENGYCYCFTQQL